MKKEFLFIVFFLIYFAIYGLVNYHFYIKLKNTFYFDHKQKLIILFFLLFMVSAPILMRLFERNGLFPLSRLLAYTGYGWMAVVFLFFSLSIIFWVYNLIKIFPHINPRYSFFIPFALSIVISIYGYFEAKNIKIEKVKIKSEKIKENLKIVQISDIHLGLTFGGERIKNIAEIIKRINPDILVSTGDLVDASYYDLSECAGYLGEIKPRYGSFAVTGNHEYYAGIENSTKFTELSGFKLLRNEYVKIKEDLCIIGIDDHTDGFKIDRNFDDYSYAVIIKHKPSVEKQNLGLFDLQLSGHTHGGQIAPFNIVTRLFYKYNSGFSRINKISSIYTSRGTGTWGPLIRFLAPPEITVIELENNFHTGSASGS